MKDPTGFAKECFGRSEDFLVMLIQERDDEWRANGRELAKDERALRLSREAELAALREENARLRALIEKRIALYADFSDEALRESGADFVFEYRAALASPAAEKGEVER